MSRNQPVNEVHLLRERSIWKDVKGRTIMVYQRWHEGGGTNYHCIEVELLMIDTMRIMKRPYKEIAALILDGKMKYVGECITV